MLCTDSRRENTGFSENKTSESQCEQVLSRCCSRFRVLLFAVKIRDLQFCTFTKRNIHLKRIFPNMKFNKRTLLELYIEKFSKQNKFVGNLCCKTNVKEFLSQIWAEKTAPTYLKYCWWLPRPGPCRTLAWWWQVLRSGWRRGRRRTLRRKGPKRNIRRRRRLWHWQRTGGWHIETFPPCLKQKESTLKGSLAGKETKEIYIDESRISGTLKQETEEGKKYISVMCLYINFMKLFWRRIWHFNCKFYKINFTYDSFERECRFQQRLGALTRTEVTWEPLQPKTLSWTLLGL